jgi:4-hydroxy-tetrahydrodipicolinate reductase
MTPIRLALIGMGKMGRTLDALAPERGFEVVARLDADGMQGFNPDRLHGAQVAIEFTTPQGAPANIRMLAAAGCPVVVGTTGWNDQRASVEDVVRQYDAALLAAANFSLGVAAFERIVAHAARVIARAGHFDAHLVETHHTAKKDAPSGTALMLGAAARPGLGADVPITSVRTGSVPGTHTLVFDAPFETITLEHVARDRRVFADGALAAARWIVGRRGIFTMQDILDSTLDLPEASA